MPDQKAELDRQVQALQEKVQALRSGQEWTTNRPYEAMLRATVDYANAGLKDAIWIFAQMYVDLAATGAWNSGAGTRHTQIPAEFADLFDMIHEQVMQAHSVEEVYKALTDGMWDAITFGPFMRTGVSMTGPLGPAFHLRANDTLLRQGAQACWEIVKAARRIMAVAIPLAASVVTGGLDGPAPESAAQLVFWTTDESGRERPPIWVEVHIALVGAHVSEAIALQAGEEWVASWDQAAGGPALRAMGDAVGSVLTATGGVAGLLVGAGLIVAAVVFVPRLVR